ncbi:MAG: hypothetical protein JJE17_02310 [Peptostreptococcaceae bacterium]|nr:hypothetical protein [Peptostreptococcaceae bacterium]
MSNIFTDIATIINISILITLGTISVWIFIDARKSNNSLASSLFWAVIALFFSPPIGIGIYFYKKHRLNDAS